MNIVSTKLHAPPLRSRHVQRPRLLAQFDEVAERKLILVSAPAGFGKTMLISEWLASRGQRAAWLSLDADDNHAARFLSYVIAALQTIEPSIGQSVLAALDAPQPSLDGVLSVVLNDIGRVAAPFTLVFDDYHIITTKAIDSALSQLIERTPQSMQVVVATREDPQLPLHRLRANGQLAEFRAGDLRFTRAEAATFLTRTMGLRLSDDDVAVLETRTEGWVAGLQLAALSLQNVSDSTRFIETFAGSHRFILDYLLEEVLRKQTDAEQSFMLRTSIFDRMCGALCDATLGLPAQNGQILLEKLEQANLFIVPLDNERRWYRYHHLFAELLRQRLSHTLAATPDSLDELHLRASRWFEDNELDLEAFHHAAAANDIERAEHLIDSKALPLHLRGAAMAILTWLQSLPAATLRARPSLLWRTAALMLINGQTTGVEEKLNAAEAALSDAERDDATRNLIGRIATARATLALTRYQPEVMFVQSRRALEFLNADNLATRANAHWTMGYAHIFLKDYAAASEAFLKALPLAQTAGAVFTTILATTGLGNVDEFNAQLRAAAETYRRILKLTGDQPLQIIYEAHLGLARVHYEWNELDTAEIHALRSLQLARQYDVVIDRFIVCEVFLARLKLAHGELTEAATRLTELLQVARRNNFVHRLAEVAAEQGRVLTRQGRADEALQLAREHALPLLEARALLAHNDVPSALPILQAAHEQATTQNWPAERLEIEVAQAAALRALGEDDAALERLRGVLAMAETQGHVRLFLDHGEPMAELLGLAAERDIAPKTVSALRAAFDAEPRPHDETQLAADLLSAREREVLLLIAQGKSNSDIAAQLHVALDTVKGHNRRIFEKLGVQRRTEAVAQARKLGVL